MPYFRDLPRTSYFVLRTLYFVLVLDRYRGRGARLSSAKAATAVRICSVPLLPPRREIFYAKRRRRFHKVLVKATFKQEAVHVQAFYRASTWGFGNRGYYSEPVVGVV